MLKRIKSILRPAVRYCRNTVTARRINQMCKQEKSLKLVIGASGVCPQGWLPIEQYFLDLRYEQDWEKRFGGKAIKAILVEHVWEHLTVAEGEVAARLCYKYLQHGGYMRIAVPDGFHPDPDYFAMVRPGGSGLGADDHKSLYTIDSLGEVFRQAGFCIKPLEYFDADGDFHAEKWDAADGMVFRSRQYDERNIGGELKFTSVIIDAVKPLKQ